MEHIGQATPPELEAGSDTSGCTATTRSPEGSPMGKGSPGGTRTADAEGGSPKGSPTPSTGVVASIGPEMADVEGGSPKGSPTPNTGVVATTGSAVAAEEEAPEGTSTPVVVVVADTASPEGSAVVSPIVGGLVVGIICKKKGRDKQLEADKDYQKHHRLSHQRKVSKYIRVR